MTPVVTTPSSAEDSSPSSLRSVKETKPDSYKSSRIRRGSTMSTTFKARTSKGQQRSRRFSAAVSAAWRGIVTSY